MNLPNHTQLGSHTLAARLLQLVLDIDTSKYEHAVICFLPLLTHIIHIVLLRFLIMFHFIQLFLYTRTSISVCIPLKLEFLILYWSYSLLFLFLLLLTQFFSNIFHSHHSNTATDQCRSQVMWQISLRKSSNQSEVHGTMKRNFTRDFIINFIINKIFNSYKLQLYSFFI